MAKDNNSKTREEPKEEVQESPIIKTPKKMGKMGMIIGITLAVLLLGGGGAIFYMLGMKPAAAEGEAAEGVSNEEPTETNIYFTDFESNVVNLAASDEYSFMYLKYGFDLEVSDEAVAKELEEKLPRITAIAATVMSNQDYNEISTPEGHERLARELTKEINECLESGTIIGVYFHTFVAQ